MSALQCTDGDLYLDLASSSSSSRLSWDSKWPPSLDISFLCLAFGFNQMEAVCKGRGRGEGPRGRDALVTKQSPRSGPQHPGPSVLTHHVQSNVLTHVCSLCHSHTSHASVNQAPLNVSTTKLQMTIVCSQEKQHTRTHTHTHACIQTHIHTHTHTHTHAYRHTHTHTHAHTRTHN